MEKTPRPDRMDSGSGRFVKLFEDDYLLSRELQILTDLSIRGAPTPRVLSTDYQLRTITMVDAGSPLTERLAGLPDRRGERLDWLRRYGPRILGAVQTICDHGVYHLDLACRNLLVSEDQPVLIDFGLALCSRFPLQKPLWLMPSERLHHPDLIAALRADWEQFFLQSLDLQRHCVRNGIAFPPALADGLAMPASAYSAYWPSDLAANNLGDPMAIVAFNAGSLVEEIGDRLGLSGTDAQAIVGLRDMLQSATEDTVAERRLAKAISQLGDLGGTPRPRASGAGDLPGPVAGNWAATERQPSTPLSRTTAGQDSMQPKAPGPKPGPPARPGLWPPSESLHWGNRAGATCLSIAGYGLIDMSYRQTGAILGDTAFAAALAAIVLGLALIVSLAFSRGLLLQRMLCLVFSGLSLPFFSELSSQGASLLQLGGPALAFVLGLAGLIALPRDPAQRPPT